MKLLVKKSSRSGALGTTVFNLYTRLEVSVDERSLLDTCNLLYEPMLIQIKEQPSGALLNSLFAMSENKKAKVYQVIEGYTFSCESLEQLVSLEGILKESALTLQEYITMANNFGGEELIDLELLLEDD